MAGAADTACARHRPGAIGRTSSVLLVAVLAAVPRAASSQVSTLDPVTVRSSRIPTQSSLGASGLDAAGLASRRGSTSDSARLLEDIPGVSLYGAGAISSLPAIHGLADDRLRLQVDGMDLTASCPNHMNSALSYIDPSKVGNVTVYAGIAPVSVGGDSIGGTVLVKSAAPAFADEASPAYTQAQAGAFYRSNSNATGFNLGATWAGHSVNLYASGSGSRADNYSAAEPFKAVAPGQEGGPPLPGNLVGSSAYDGSRNVDVGLAVRHENHLLQVGLGQQTVDFEGFPNQRMDMTANRNTLLNLRYTGNFAWGELEARLYGQDTQHEMDMGPDRYTYGTGMPMDTEGTTRGVKVQGNWVLSDADIVRLGAEYQNYTLYDWWPPVGGTMGPNTFWNIDYGQREQVGAFAEVESRLDDQWVGLIGVRANTVYMNAGPVQGYDNGLPALWGNDAAAFNAQNRERTDHNWDFTVIARYAPAATTSVEAGYARKSRSPNLYQRYAWSTQPMAALMNNFVGDGNGYIGYVDLLPEVAHTVSVTANWAAADSASWAASATAYYTRVDDYIDARRCDFSQCSAENATKTTGFVLLQYVNQSARLYGLDLSGRLALAQSEDYGSFTGTATLGYVRGQNRSTGDNLYNMMPLNIKLAAVQQWGAWTNAIEFQAVAAKTKVSQVRNEVPTPAYEVLNLRSGVAWSSGSLEVGLVNALNRFYSLPLGGAYLGQGPSMTTNGIPWGVPVPGMGRSISVALNLYY